MTKNIVVSLYDYTGEAVRPWAEAGYTCYCFDIQHPEQGRRENLPSGGSINYVKADLHSVYTLIKIADDYAGRVAFMFAFPVCTDLAVSGARHFAAKEAANPGFQEVAARHARLCGQLGDILGCPYLIENPVSRLATLWRKPDHVFNPCDYGGYLPEDDQHPRWPEYIAPRDAYTKRTCLWTGGGFTMPEAAPVEPLTLTYTKADGTVINGSQQFGKLGGKSAKTKNIRSATPRGFALAVFKAHHNATPEQAAA